MRKGVEFGVIKSLEHQLTNHIETSHVSVEIHVVTTDFHVRV